MTYGDIEQKVRTLVNDTEVPYRFEQPTVLGFIADAVRHLRNVNPSEKYNDAGVLDESLEKPEEWLSVRFHPRHEEAVVKYAAHLVYQLDMSDTVNMGISEALRTRAETLMQL